MGVDLIVVDVALIGVGVAPTEVGVAMTKADRTLEVGVVSTEVVGVEAEVGVAVKATTLHMD